MSCGPLGLDHEAFSKFIGPWHFCSQNSLQDLDSMEQPIENIGTPRDLSSSDSVLSIGEKMEEMTFLQA